VVGTTALNVYTSRSASRITCANLRRRDQVDAGLVDPPLPLEPPARRACAARRLVAGYGPQRRDRVPRLAVPTWIAWGRLAKSPEVESADLWLHHLPHGALEVFEPAGNLPHAEVPTAFCKKLEGFLAGLG
jgi:pimeloyl-ACP methyl ester carboxylesterase